VNLATARVGRFNRPRDRCFAAIGQARGGWPRRIEKSGQQTDNEVVVETIAYTESCSMFLNGWRKWLNNLAQQIRGRRHRIKGNGRRLPLVLERLEDRVTPSSAAYLTAGGSPWGSNPDPNVTAMNTVFGPGHWDQDTFSSPGAALSGSYKFIFLEGGNTQGPAFESFISSNEARLQTLVSNGAALLMNAARNAWTNVNFPIGFGATLEGQQYANQVALTSAGLANLSGPSTPIASNYQGGSFSHDIVVGSGLTPFITVTSGVSPGQADLAGRQWGSGYVMIGGWTAPGYWTPSSPQGNNLVANIISYTESQAPT
jgi:hypothetical protein